MRESDGVVIHNLNPDNQVAVFEWPAAWTELLKELGQALTLANICAQGFYGWASGIEDVPERRRHVHVKHAAAGAHGIERRRGGRHRHAATVGLVRAQGRGVVG